jgi:hypothetical protein
VGRTPAPKGRLQAGGFASFQHFRISDLSAGVVIGQFAGTLEYLPAKWGRFGMFLTRSFLDDAVLKTVGTQQYTLAVANQVGISGTFARFNRFWIDANLAFVQRTSDSAPQYNTFTGSAYAPGLRSWNRSFLSRLTLPHALLQRFPFDFFIEGGFNQGLLTPGNPAHLTFGLQFHTWPTPNRFGSESVPAPVEIPRVLYEVVVRDAAAGRAPVANAGPSRSGVTPGKLVQLDGSGSLLAVSYAWSEITKTGVTINNVNSPAASFIPKASTTYIFQLLVTAVNKLTDTARVTISTANDASIVNFTATPPNITAGDSAVLHWVTQDADNVTQESTDLNGAHNSLGKVAVSDSLVVKPLVTATYKLTAQQGTSTPAAAAAVITVGAVKPIITSFVAASNTVRVGGTTTLTWTTQGAATVTLDGQPVSVNGSKQVTVIADTTYTLVASNGNPADNTKATVSIHTSLPKVPLIENFSATTPVIYPGEQVELHWSVQHATSVAISGNWNCCG